ncbi:hypothetical protein ASV53_22815, partial [Photobacterium sanguinicancri]
MVTATEKAALKAKLENYEGKVNHMYLDSKGYVTVGVGPVSNTHIRAHETELQLVCRHQLEKKKGGGGGGGGGG